jgi:hypothetical protein
MVIHSAQGAARADTEAVLLRAAFDLCPGTRGSLTPGGEFRARKGLEGSVSAPG